MKARESAMPDEMTWQAFFDADATVSALGCARQGNETIAEFGCGYGTFTLGAPRRTTGIVHAFDIEATLVDRVLRKASAAGIANIHTETRDFVANGTGLCPSSVDHAMLWNLLHLENPRALLREAHRILRPGGIVSILHWNHDPSTPRGPSMSIRPHPDQCRAWAETAGFAFLRNVDLSTCARYHYGMLLDASRRK